MRRRGSGWAQANTSTTWSGLASRIWRYSPRGVGAMRTSARVRGSISSIIPRAIRQQRNLHPVADGKDIAFKAVPLQPPAQPADHISRLLPSAP